MTIKGGLHHQILYISNIEWIDDEGYGRIEWNPPSFTMNGHEIPEDDYIEIHDDLFRYFHDFFIWIETHNPVGPKEFNRGFNYYGLTAIRDENLIKFSKLISSLLNLFENASETVILTGDFTFGYPPDVEVPLEPYNDPHVGYYQVIEIKREKLLQIFSDLKNVTERAIENNGYLLHFGI